MSNKLFPVLTLLAAIVLPACNESADEEITTVRETTQPAAAPQAADMSAADRFGFRSQRAAATSGAAMPSYAFETPPGWQKLPASSSRPVNFQVAGDPNAECYFSVLGGTGGGLTANVNRWRQQMGLDALSDEEVAQLPKKELLGRDAVYVKLDGAFAGMTNEPKENYRLVGLIALDANNAYFVKMTGPAPVLEGQEENLDLFAASLKQAAPADPHAGMDIARDPHAGAAPMTGNGAPSRWNWQAPEGWTKAADRPMRAVTFTTGPDNAAEAYVTELSAMAGNVEANVNRWRQQMGQPPLTPEQIGDLPKVSVMGQEAPMVSIDGTYTDDMRGGTHADYTMYGVVVPGADYSLFVKMVGPKDQMEAERENFIAFSESITQAE